MSQLKVGDKFPEGVTFNYIPYTTETCEVTSCGVPIKYEASKEFAGKKVVIFAVPGAFTPGCSEHLPGYIDKLDKFREKGVDIIVCIASNDPYVMSAWGKVNHVEHNEILFLCDPGLQFSKKFGWTSGDRTARYAIAIDRDGKIVYAEKEPGKDITVSSADAVLAKL